MDSSDEITEKDDCNEFRQGKRSHLSDRQEHISKKQKVVLSQVDEKELGTGKQSTLELEKEVAGNLITVHQHQSPKKRLEVPANVPLSCNNCNNVKTKPKDKFIYGNYNKYYGYRNKDKDFQDIRLNVFETHHELFQDKLILDIGCNSGLITLELAKRFPIKHITGIDIDRGLINQVTKHVTKNKKTAKQDATSDSFPFNVNFLHANYVLRDDVLLEVEREQFDLILCLSVTKWIHLNFGDAGLKQSFRRMFLQLRPGGKLILEPQPFDNYGRRKKITETIFANFKSMKFFPKDFTDYLLSSEVGFESMTLMAVPEHCVAGFKRPIQIFNKS